MKRSNAVASSIQNPESSAVTAPLQQCPSAALSPSTVPGLQKSWPLREDWTSHPDTISFCIASGDGAAFLSNMFILTLPMQYNGLTFGSVEALFQVGRSCVAAAPHENHTLDWEEPLTQLLFATTTSIHLGAQV